MKKDKDKLSMYAENCIVLAKNGETREHFVKFLCSEYVY